MPQLQTVSNGATTTGLSPQAVFAPNPLDEEIETLLRDFRESTIPGAESLLRGARHNLAETARSLSEASSYWPTGLFSRASGFTAALRRQHTMEQNNVRQREQFVSTLQQQNSDMLGLHQTVLRREREGQLLEQETTRLLAAGALTQEAFESRLALAQEHYNAAQNGRVQIVQLLESSRAQSTSLLRQEMRGLQSINQQIRQAAENLRRTEVCMRTARNVCVIAGATIATGGVAAGATLSFATVSSAVALGTTAGTTIGLVSNVAEAGSQIAHGRMDLSQAAENALRQTGTDLRNSAVASVTTIPGLAVSRVIAPLGQTVSTGRNVVAGMSAGGTSSSLASLTQSTINVATGDRPLHVQEILLEAGRDGLIGTLTGGVGARASIARHGAGTSSQIMTTSAEVAGSLSIGLGIHELYALGVHGRHLTFDEAAQSVIPSIFGTAVGGFAQNARARSGQPPTLTPEEFQQLPIDKKFALLMENWELYGSIPDPMVWNRGEGGSAFPMISRRINPPEPPALVAAGVEPSTVPMTVLGEAPLPIPSSLGSATRRQAVATPASASAPTPENSPNGGTSGGSNPQQQPSNPLPTNAGNIPSSGVPPQQGNPPPPSGGDPQPHSGPEQNISAGRFWLPRESPAELMALAFDHCFSHPDNMVRAAARAYVAKQISKNPDFWQQYVPRLLRGLLIENENYRSSCVGALRTVDASRPEHIALAMAVYAAYRIELSPRIRAEMEMTLLNLTNLDSMAGVAQLFRGRGNRSASSDNATPETEMGLSLLAQGRGAESDLVRETVSLMVEGLIEQLTRR